jgi:diketogulonate reductase-like aldo/keto reductase
MRQAQAALGQEHLACNQMLYHLRDRNVEREVLPWCERQKVAVVGYTPLARGGYMKAGAVAAVAKTRGVTPRQVTLNFLTRRPALFTIPKASHPEHVRENAAALAFTLTREEIGLLEGRRA